MDQTAHFPLRFDYEIVPKEDGVIAVFICLEEDKRPTNLIPICIVTHDFCTGKTTAYDPPPPGTTPMPLKALAAPLPHSGSESKPLLAPAPQRKMSHVPLPPQTMTFTLHCRVSNPIPCCSHERAYNEALQSMAVRQALVTHKRTQEPKVVEIQHFSAFTRVYLQIGAYAKQVIHLHHEVSAPTGSSTGCSSHRGLHTADDKLAAFVAMQAGYIDAGAEEVRQMMEPFGTMRGEEKQQVFAKLKEGLLTERGTLAGRILPPCPPRGDDDDSDRSSGIDLAELQSALHYFDEIKDIIKRP